MAYSYEDFARETNVSRETLEDYRAWHALLLKWNRRINLVSPKALDDFWRRHALDSWQITPHIPKDARSFIDLGSGAGFPGISIAIDCKARGRGEVLMVEAAGKKTSFLRAVIRELGLPARASSERAEDLEPAPYDVISARAFAPFPKLMSYAQPFWGQNSLGLLLKGESAPEELTEAEKSWSYEVETVPSLSDPTGRLLKVTGLKRHA